jgi:broad specificity phosphatase PhoE
LGRSKATLAELQANPDKKVELGLVYQDARLNERSLGELEGQPNTFIQSYADGNLSDAPGGGESYLEVARRTLSFLLDLGEEAQKNHWKKVLLCGHMGPMRIFWGIFHPEASPQQILQKQFKNTELISVHFDRIHPPYFLKEVFATCRPRLAKSSNSPSSEAAPSI